MEEKLDLVLHELKAMNQGLQGVTTKVDKLEANMQIVTTRIGQLENKMQFMTVKMENFEDRLQGMENKVDHLETGQKELSQLVRAIYDRQESTDAKLDGIAKNIHQRYDLVKQNNTTIHEMKEEQKSIFEILGSHDVSIRTLQRNIVKSP